MNKRMSKIVIAFLVVFGGLIAFNLIRQSMTQYYLEHYHRPAVTVSAMTTKTSDWHPYFSSIGTFVAVNGVNVNTQSAGKVSAIYFSSGQYVEKDSPLIDLDDTADQAMLKYHQADLSLQQANFKRQQDLLKRNATAVSNVDESRAKMLQAQANVEHMQATINLKHIKAPFTGVLGIRQIDLGQYVQPGTTTIVPLQSLDPIYLNFYIPEQYINRIKMNQNIVFTVEQNPKMRFMGKITAIDSKINEKTHNIQVQALVANCPIGHLSKSSPTYTDIPFAQRISLRNDRYGIQCDTTANSAHNIRQFNFIPGMFAAIEIEQPVLKDVITLPTTAISYSMYGDSVFVIEQQNNTEHKKVLAVKRTYITPGETQGNYTIIKKGIQPNQLVVTSGELKLQDGTEVVIDPSHALVDHDDIESLGE